MRYINFHFKNIDYSDDYYRGTFSAPDNDVLCEFEYNRHNDHIKIWDNNQPAEEITPIPIWWLNKKLKENGYLKKNESKISY